MRNSSPPTDEAVLNAVGCKLNEFFRDRSIHNLDKIVSKRLKYNRAYSGKTNKTNFSLEQDYFSENSDSVADDHAE